MWNSPIPEQRWRGFRREKPGVAAFESLASFEQASLSELKESLADHELVTLGRLLARGKKEEIEVFIRTHGPNPLFDPHCELDVPVGVAKADVLDLRTPATQQANQAILEGEVLHILFQAGEATRFAEGPLYNLNPYRMAQETSAADNAVKYYLQSIGQTVRDLDQRVSSFLLDLPLGPKQPFLLRAAIRRVIQDEIQCGRLTVEEAPARYKEALAHQKILFFVSSRHNLNQVHSENLREKFSFYGFEPSNVVTIEQELARGLTCDEEGKLRLLEDMEARDATGHLYALIQASRASDFTTYTESGRPIKPMELDAFSYFLSRGAKVMNVIRINDMDRHSTEIINAKALTFALSLFEKGYVNAIETVSNPSGQKGGTGSTFGNSEFHVLTETHENSFPLLARAFEAAVQTYLKENEGRHPAYNAMRQWADLAATRRVLKEWGGRIVFVPRQKMVGGQEISYLGVDMPMGDLSLLQSHYPSRMFQFAGDKGRELLIHDMKQKEHMGIALRSLLSQLEDPHILLTIQEVTQASSVPFSRQTGQGALYGAPCPEFEI
ncbi:MAG: hypothetical protein KCHDKBKB_01955 [Elusimicrobia bacterium]|nr:hypothetical protein [Elusimicrobiota bacterium]